MSAETSGGSSFWNLVQQTLYQCRESRKLVLVIVAIGLLLDNMLLTAVVPIIPEFLYNLHHQEDLEIINETLPISAIVDQGHSERSQLLSKVFSDTSPKFSIQCQKELEEYLAPLTTTESATEEVTTVSYEFARLRHQELVNENAEVGVMFASKPIVQAITNPFVGPLTNRIGYSLPLFMGLILLFFSTMIFAIGRTYPVLFIARSLQGVGSAFTSVAGMGLLADKYPDDRERGNSMAIALGGLALGVLIGPPFGGVMYQFIGKSSPFIVLSLLALMDGCLQLFVLQPKVIRDEQEGASLLTLIRDPYIIVAAAAITFANLGIAILEPSLPLWMMDTMNANNWEQGAAFLPSSIAYLIGTNIFGPLGHRMGRWLASLTGLVIIGLALLNIPMATSLSELIIPNGLIGFAIGMVDSSMMPMLGYLVDIRHTSIYGSVYAIGDVAFCVGFAVGPALSGTLVSWLGFSGLCTITGLICIAFAPCMILLRKPPGKNEAKMLVNENTVKYVNYTNSDTPEEVPIGPTTTIPGSKSFEMVP